jgi:hypothetical protein
VVAAPREQVTPREPPPEHPLLDDARAPQHPPLLAHALEAELDHAGRRIVAVDAPLAHGGQA